MALSDDERARLAELEALLVEDDPKLAQTLRGANRPPRPAASSPRALVVGGLGFVAGLALLVSGISWHWTISVLGFVVMAISAVIGLGLLRPAGLHTSARPAQPSKRPQVSSASKDQFMDKLEERWRRRQGH